MLLEFGVVTARMVLIPTVIQLPQSQSRMVNEIAYTKDVELTKAEGMPKDILPGKGNSMKLSDR